MTEKQHLARISKLVEERYMTEESGYTSFEVYPMYNEYDELKFAVVEFQPHGFMYVRINRESLYNNLGDLEGKRGIVEFQFHQCVFQIVISMYTHDYAESIWYP